MRSLKIGANLIGLLLLELILTLVTYTPGRENQRFEGLSGSSGTGRLSETGAADILAANGLSVLYRFSGVTDDGRQGSASRKEATTVMCTNIDDLNTVQVEVQILPWNGTEVYTGTMSLAPNRTGTFSTQNTTIYFEDVVLGGLPGTPAINQGSGRILSSNTNVICTVQVLDPLNNPPVFMDKLALFDKNGNLVGTWRKIYLPIVLKS